MPFDLSADQELYRDTTARFLGEHAPTSELRRLRDDAAGFTSAYWTQGTQLGWTSLLVDEAHGGGSISEAGLVDLTLVADTFGRHAAPGPLVPVNVVAAALSEDDGDRWAGVLGELLAGEAIATWCLAEPAPNASLGTVALEVRADGDEVVLDGVKRPVESAAQARHLLVTGRTGAGLTQVLVPADAPGLTIEPMRTVDVTRRFDRVTFEDVRVPATAVVGAVGEAEAQVERQLQIALVLTNAESVGVMQAAFDMTVEWAFDRYSFGRPLASYQALKHRYADMYSWLQASHAISDEATAATAAGDPDAARLVSAAKAFIGQYGSELLQECVQLHGGIGVTFEHDIHVFLRRHTVNVPLYGAPGEHRRRITDLLEAEEAALSADEREDLEAFRRRARAWIHEHLKPVGPLVVSLRADRTDEEELAAVARDREVQRMLFDADLAGICIPREYEGQGLTPAHQQALNQELTGFEYPMRFQVPTLAPCASVLLDFGTEEQKRRHIPAILKGEELWMQLLSEPSGGSDVAGALTTAVRDGDEWVLNGSKVWTTGAWWSDWGLCLARTNWDVPKHRGLTVFMLPVHQPGIEVHRIEMLNGNREFCQEFLTDVRVPDSDRIGEVDDGWTVGTRWMFHERMLYSSALVTVPDGTMRSGDSAPMLSVARDAGRIDDPVARDLVGEAWMLDAVVEALKGRVGRGIATGAMSDQSSAAARLFGGIAGTRRTSIAFELAGAAAAAWLDDDGETANSGADYLMRQVTCIGGGTTEMARNVISERVLGMPRERTVDRDVAFRDVPRSPG